MGLIAHRASFFFFRKNYKYYYEEQWIDVGGNPIVRHAGVAARVRNKTCYPLGNGLRWTDPEVIALYFLFSHLLQLLL